MSKSILVIDTPKNCNECELHVLAECDYDKEFYCVANGKMVEEFACRKTRSDWCQLRDLPEKKEKINIIIITKEALLMVLTLALTKF